MFEQTQHIVKAHALAWREQGAGDLSPTSAYEV